MLINQITVHTFETAKTAKRYTICREYPNCRQLIRDSVDLEQCFQDETNFFNNFHCQPTETQYIKIHTLTHTHNLHRMR